MIEVVAPTAPGVPLVFASPHSGCRYPPEFVAAARLDPVALRRSEDAFVDELYAAAPAVGATLLKAHFPRAYVDPNRERLELDPAMFDGPLPPGCDIHSARVRAGLGTIARVVTNGEGIYRALLDPALALERIAACYDPYHAALAGLIAEVRAAFGVCILIDCHSMPSVGGPMDSDTGANRVDFVLGDRFGRSCAPGLTRLVERTLVDMGYVVRLNAPYAGGYTTHHYGRPGDGVHALQIEVNRALYMDEDAIVKTAGFEPLRERISDLVKVLADAAPEAVV